MYTSKIISSDKDLVALVFYGTKESKNPKNSFKHVYVYHDLDSPGGYLVYEKLKKEKMCPLSYSILYRMQ